MVNENLPNGLRAKEHLCDVKDGVLRITVDWDTSQADDFRTRGVPWTIKRTSLERGRVTRSDREDLT
jgi:hypothetical protein